ncbi:helix-turn-helix domain-containing protein [Streptomyces sp. NPDC051020]|uniref:helix-turn-helix domain-containing protein n=1 Tax=Streptomyces sp. NPDC051020 TaxID=3155409 RepID=UPI003430AA61
MVDSADQHIRITGEEAQRVKREALGIPDRRKHHGRASTRLKGRTKEPGTQQRVYRYRFYPDPAQAEQLEKTFGACRWVYNEGLTLRANAWERHRLSVGFAESCRALIGAARGAAGRVSGRDVSVTDRRAVGRHACGAHVRPAGCDRQCCVGLAAGGEAGSAASVAGVKSIPLCLHLRTGQKFGALAAPPDARYQSPSNY